MVRAGTIAAGVATSSNGLLMRVRLLGTGSADGWPNAFCDCASCLAAHRAGQWRGPTSALVDDRLLLDCGPETPRAALRYGNGLHHVSHVLITHNHPDHSAPMALLARGWAGRTEPLTVVGTEAVIASWCLWVGPDDPVRWRVVLPGDVLDADGYTVRVLGAAHGDEQAVVYDVTGPTGERLLYATDTGPLPEATITATTDADYDLVMLEATFGDRRGPGAPAGEDHLDLSSFADQMVRLRGARALTRGSRVAAVHLSHQSPPDLRPRLAAWGVQVLDDGHELVLDRAARAQRADATARAASGAPPARRTLVLGGVRSGKSAVAEQLLAAESQVTYVATGNEPDGDDAEWAERVARHRADRPQHWTTLETTDVAAALRTATTPLVVDCLGMWLTRVLGDVGAWSDQPGWADRLERRVDDLVSAWHAVSVPVVAVSNEVGSGVVPGTRSGRVFRDALGRLNTRLSAASESVLLVIAGRTVDLAALPLAMAQAQAQAGAADAPPAPAAPAASPRAVAAHRAAAPLRSVRPVPATALDARAVDATAVDATAVDAAADDTAAQSAAAARPRPLVDLTVHDRRGPFRQDSA
jgi:adenosylcobinamide kinase / adenosylcobinamide-phosphate guanylyltransferase